LPGKRRAFFRGTAGFRFSGSSSSGISIDLKIR
jgi:hypothetical protein